MQSYCLYLVICEFGKRGTKNRTLKVLYSFQAWITDWFQCSGVARAFLGVAHPEGQNEEENK